MNDAPCPDSKTFASVLFPGAGSDVVAHATEPACFRDLSLDRIVAAVVEKKEAFDLASIFYVKASTIDEITYRQEIMRDLERSDLMQAVMAFSAGMQAMRERLAQGEKLHYRYERERWLLGAAELYGTAVEKLVQAMLQAAPGSRGLQGLTRHAQRYASSEAFIKLTTDTAWLIAALADIRYCLHIKGQAITVQAYDGQIDASVSIEATFAKFRQGAVKSYLASFSHWTGLDHVDAQILERVALLFPETFGKLERYGVEHAHFLDDALVRFDREIQFYVAYLSYIQRFRGRGMPFCYPQVGDTKAILGRDVFDMALAEKLFRENGRVVTNDFHLRNGERLFVVSGPNQGGKTTFARTLGQLHWLANLGCPVPGREANLYFFDQLFTHFEKEEHVTSLRGKLKDDLIRIRSILDQATSRSLVIMNEIFSSTTLDDAVFLGKKIMAALSRLDVIGVCVTFLTELASFDEKTVSMMSTIDPADPAIRTYKLERRPADGLAYALAIAEKYRVTYQGLMQRIRT